MKVRRLGALLLLIVIFSGCSAQKSEQPSLNNYGENITSEYARDASAPMAAPMSPQEAGGMMDAEESYNVTADDAGSLGLNVSEIERKIIKTAAISSETYNFDESAKTLLDIVLVKGGYVEKADTELYYVDKDTKLKRGNYVVRIPQENFETAKDEIEKIGKVITSGMGGNDVTGQYYDIESRLNIKKEEEKRVFEMIAKAEKIEDLIVLEQRLSEIRTDIEIYQTKLNSIDRLSSFSTISLSLTEIREADKIVYSDDFAGRLKSAFVASINFVISFFQMVVLFIVAIFVPALIVGIIGFVVWIFIRKRINKK